MIAYLKHCSLPGHQYSTDRKRSAGNECSSHDATNSLSVLPPNRWDHFTSKLFRRTQTSLPANDSCPLPDQSNPSGASQREGAQRTHLGSVTAGTIHTLSSACENSSSGVWNEILVQCRLSSYQSPREGLRGAADSAAPTAEHATWAQWIMGNQLLKRQCPDGAHFSGRTDAPDRALTSVLASELCKRDAAVTNVGELKQQLPHDLFNGNIRFLHFGFFCSRQNKVNRNKTKMCLGDVLYNQFLFQWNSDWTFKLVDVIMIWHSVQIHLISQIIFLTLGSSSTQALW